MSLDNVSAMISRIGDRTRDLPSQFINQLDQLAKMIKMLGDRSFNEYLKIDGPFLADLLSQFLMALKLISAEPSVCNLTLVFTCCLTKLKLTPEQYKRVFAFVTAAIETAVASINTLGFKSEVSVSKIVDVFSAVCGETHTLVNDQVIDIVVHFIAKLIAFWATFSGGFKDSDFRLSNMPKLVEQVRSILAEGGDLIEALFGGFEFVTNHFTEFIKGDFESLFFGKAETSAFETRVSKINKSYVLLRNGSHDVLKEEFGFTPNSFDTEVSELLKMGDRFMKKARDPQKPPLKRMLDELREIQVDRFVKQAQTQTKMSAVGICFVGGSGVGKSTLMESTAKTLISAAGEIPAADKIVAGQMSDKFDSNEQPHHLVLMYDDVANNSANENFDKLLNAVNSQSRPFLKASVEEKGIMFPNNIGCVISTNVLGYNAHKSNCPDSLGRRFLHIITSIKPSLRDEVCVPGTDRLDAKLAMRDGTRFDIWKFDVIEFVTFDELRGDGVDMPEDIERIEYEGRFMYGRRLKWTDKDIKEYTYWDLAQFLGKYAKTHYDAQKILMDKLLNSANTEYCTQCHIPKNQCCCTFEPEFVSPMLDNGIERVVANYKIFSDAFKEWYSMARVRAVLTLSFALCPIRYKVVVPTTLVVWMIISLLCQLSVLAFCGCTFIGATLSIIALVCLAWRKVYYRISHRVGVLSHLADNTVDLLSKYRKEIFVGEIGRAHV